jgi:hypothetical protein
MKQCPLCFWVKGDHCDDWHYARRTELDEKATPEICDLCAIEQDVTKALKGGGDK